jgi:catechol 2,3-dioxygenase-like lactoylglutathione lyase family enzyme
MTILGIHHVQITIPQGAEEQGRQFYCQLLGLTEIEKPKVLQARGGFWLQVGDRQVHVGTEDGVERESTKAHIAYQVSDIDVLRMRLQENGVSIQDDVPLPGLARFQIRDPFGNRIEFIQQLLG